jgi:multicomponent Na+:H+ antiporter subunit G
VAGRAIVIVAFLFLTAPVAAHAIGRAGYRRGSPLWTGTVADELGGDAAGKESTWTR